MRRLIGGVFQSLDGVMQAPGGPEEDPTGGFAFGGWIWPHSDKTSEQAIGKLFDSSFDLLLGRKTYEIFAAYWPFIPESDPIARAFSRAAKYVLTRGNDRFEWGNSHKLPDIEAVRKLKTGLGPNLLIQGSSTLYPQLLAAGLIDQMTIMTFPIVLGRGKRLFGEGTPPLAMKLVAHEVSSTGVVIATYAPDGEVPTTGEFTPPNPSPAEMKRRERMKRDG